MYLLDINIVSSPSVDNEQWPLYYNAINKRDPRTVPGGPNYQFRIVINTPTTASIHSQQYYLLFPLASTDLRVLIVYYSREK